MRPFELDLEEVSVQPDRMAAKGFWTLENWPVKSQRNAALFQSLRFCVVRTTWKTYFRTCAQCVGGQLFQVAHQQSRRISNYSIIVTPDALGITSVLILFSSLTVETTSRLTSAPYFSCRSLACSVVERHMNYLRTFPACSGQSLRK